MKAIIINWELLGAELANLGSIDQANFLNGFINEMLSWDTHANRVMQCECIQDRLDEKVKNFIISIGT